MSGNDYWLWDTLLFTQGLEVLSPGILEHFLLHYHVQSAGSDNRYPDFAWNPAVLENEDRLCHVVHTDTTKASSTVVLRLQTLANYTARKFSNLSSNKILSQFVSNIFPAAEIEE